MSSCSAFVRKAEVSFTIVVVMVSGFKDLLAAEEEEDRGIFSYPFLKEVFSILYIAVTVLLDYKGWSLAKAFEALMTQKGKPPERNLETRPSLAYPSPVRPSVVYRRSCRVSRDFVPTGTNPNLFCGQQNACVFCPPKWGHSFCRNFRDLQDIRTFALPQS